MREYLHIAVALSVAVVPFIAMLLSGLFLAIALSTDLMHRVADAVVPIERPHHQESGEAR